MSLRIGDKVVVIAGKDTGKDGVIVTINRLRNRVTLSGVSTIKKHVKKSAQYPEGGIVEKHASLHISNILLKDPKTGKPTRFGYKIDNKGTKERYAKKSDQVITYPIRNTKTPSKK
jgi:large subunit ribosomal protein L24